MAEGKEPMVSAVDMAKKYGDFIALHPLNVEVHAGEFFGVFGPNGAGNAESGCWTMSPMAGPSSSALTS